MFRRATLLVLAVGQIVAATLVGLYGGGEITTGDRAGEPAIVPAGYAFSIWGLIELLCLVYAVWALPARRPDPDLRDRLAAPLIVTFAGFSAWLVAAEVEPVGSTLVILAVMVGGLLVAVRRALAERERIRAWGRFGSTVFWSMAGLYLGWTSIAVWLNLTTTTVFLGAPVAGAAGVAGQLAVLLGATAGAVAIVRWTGALVAYVAAVAWAFVGAVIGASGAGQPLLAGAAAVGLVAVLAVGAVTTLRRRRVAA